MFLIVKSKKINSPKTCFKFIRNFFQIIYLAHYYFNIIFSLSWILIIINIQNKIIKNLACLNFYLQDLELSLFCKIHVMLEIVILVLNSNDARSFFFEKKHLATSHCKIFPQRKLVFFPLTFNCQIWNNFLG